MRYLIVADLNMSTRTLEVANRDIRSDDMTDGWHVIKKKIGLSPASPHSRNVTQRFI